MMSFSQQPTFHFNNNIAINTFPSTASTTPSLAAPTRRGIKRASTAEDFATSSTEKRGHYENETQMVDGFDSIQLGDSCSSSPNYNEPIEHLDSAASSPTMLDEDAEDTLPLVEEPEDEEDDDRLLISDELRRYIDAMKQEKLLLPRSNDHNNALALYNPADDIKQRITELVDEDVHEPTPNAAASTLLPSTSASMSTDMFDLADAEEEMEVD